MKKKLIYFLFCFLLLVSFLIPVSAATSLVLDYAGIMSSMERTALEEQARQLQNAYDLDVVILTTPKLYDVPIQNFADDFYENNSYSDNGVLLLLDMGSRQWHITTSGSAIGDLSDRDLAKIEKTVVPYFSEGRYYEGFARFQDMLPRLLTNDQQTGGQFSLVVSLLVGAGIAGVAILIMRVSMNTKKLQRSAANYETEGTYRLKTHQDLFLYSNVSKRPRPQNNSSGSSVHHSSSGRSHGGRGGRF